jgi:L-alanine-DL-glutamate epimerase-like enolase superfamily enzyme
LVRITEVETICLRLPDVDEVCDGSQDAFLVHIETDTGISGLGEGDSMPTVLKAIVEAPLSNSIGRGLRDVLVGEDPLRIEPLVKKMMDSTLYLGGSSARLTTISAVEMALWDLKGKTYERPVHELLGGSFHESVRAYASILFPENPRDLDQVRADAIRLREAGFTALKFGWGGFGRTREDDVALVRTAREAAGPDTRLMIDVGLCWDLTTTLERAKALEEFDLYWLEAPMPHEPVSAWAELCARSPIRISSESAGRILGEPAFPAGGATACDPARCVERGRDRRVETSRPGRSGGRSVVRAALLQHRHRYGSIDAPPGQPAC